MLKRFQIRNSMMQILKWTKLEQYLNNIPQLKMMITWRAYLMDMRNKEQTREVILLVLIFLQKKMLGTLHQISFKNGTIYQSKIPRSIWMKDLIRHGLKSILMDKDLLTLPKHSTSPDNSWEHSPLWLMSMVLWALEELPRILKMKEITLLKFI